MCFVSVTHRAEAEYSTAKTSVWWDIENCPVPKGWDAHTIAQKLISALLNLNYRGPLSITAYGNTDLIPKAVQQALSSTGISLNHVPSGRKDASDKKILVDMFLWVLENPAPANLMLISGDGDFSYALNRLRMLSYNILLAHPLQASPFLVASARTSWMWRSLIASGCPSTRSCCCCCCSFGSEHALSTGSVSSKAGKLKGIYVPKAQETKRNKLSETECLCNVACKSTEVFTTGREQAAQFQLKQNLELLGEPQNIAAAEQDTEIMNKVVEAGVEMNAPSVAKKQAEALVIAKNIEEIVQDNDLKSRDAQEFIKCLEKEKKELMEAITASERSEREFWENFKVRLDKNGVAPLSVDHVFSELSRDFHVPKEVREPTQNDIEIDKLESMLKQGLGIESGEPENNVPAEPAEDMTKTKKSTVIRDKYEPYVCGICNVVCAHPSVFESHRKGRKHAAKFKKHIEALFASHQIQEEVIQDNGLPKDLTKIEDKAEPYVCSICDVICDHPAVFESHHKGRKHAAKFKKHTEGLFGGQQIQDVIIQDNGLPRGMTKELQIKPVKAPEAIYYLDDQREELGERCATSERSVEEFFFHTVEEVGENDYKSLPNAECFFTELNTEFSASKESREWIDAIFKKPEVSEDANLTREFGSIPNENLEMNSGDPESSSAGITEHPEEEYMGMKDKLTKDKAEREAYVCCICNVICLSPTVYETHLLGRKHTARVKKHAEVLFDDKTILEESLVEEDHHPRDALEVLRFQPKDAQESIKEELEDNESEQIPRAEFPEPKEARERVDLVVKMLEDTSKQTLVEVENDASDEPVEETRMENGDSATQIWVCEWCSVMCSSQKVFDTHLAGKKHVATMKKHVPVVKMQVFVVKDQVGTKFAYVIKNGP